MEAPEDPSQKKKKRRSESLQEHPDGPDEKKKRMREEKLSLHHVVGLTEGQRKKKKKRRSEGQQDHLAPVSLSPSEAEIKDEEEEEEVHLLPPGGLTQSQKKTKKKRTTYDEEENVLPSSAELMQHQDRKKKKKRIWEEPPAAVDLDTPRKKKKDKERREEELSLPPPDGPRHDQKKKKKKKKMEVVRSQQEDKDQVCIAMAAISPDQEEALDAEETNLSTKKKKSGGNTTQEDTKKKKKKSGGNTTQEDTKKKNVKQQKKKTKPGDLSSSQEEEIDWALVKELQEYLPHVKKKCVNQIKKMLGCDLHRFRKFRQQGVPARLGRFSEQENQQIRENVTDFLALTGIGSVEKLLFPQRFREEQATIRKLKKQHGFMERIAEGIPRPCHQVYLRALKMFDEKNHMGRFSEEELAALIRFHHLHGNNWKLISEKMDRSVYSLQKRFATIGVDHGVWSSEEERRLKQAVREYLETRVGSGSASGSGLSRDQLSKRLPWREISQKVQTRSWIQCRTKWLFILEHRMTCYGNVFNRGAEGYEAKIRLISTLYNTSVDDIADINWEEVAEAVGTMSY
ncbi:transcription termination factor 1-like isoform 2-T2 [Anableps anableps]